MSEKVQAVQEARGPRNVSELKSYLGVLTYYSRFLPNMATALNPVKKGSTLEVDCSREEGM